MRFKEITPILIIMLKKSSLAGAGAGLCIAVILNAYYYANLIRKDNINAKK